MTTSDDFLSDNSQTVGFEFESLHLDSAELDNKLMQAMKLEVMKAAVPAPSMASSSVASSNTWSNSWPNSVHTPSTSSGYMPSQSWIPQCAHCLIQEKYSPAVTLIGGDAVCTDCAKQALNIIVED
jgi:hypothetical protein